MAGLRRAGRSGRGGGPLDRAERDRLGLGRGERPLAWARADRSGSGGAADPRDAGADVWVGTRRALYVPAGVGGVRRIPWTSVDRADWNDPAQQLRVVELAPFGEVMPRTVGRLRGADRLLQLVRERVTASVVVVRTVPLRDRRGVRVVARRDPDTTAELTWSAVLDAGLDPSDPAVVADAEAAVARVRAEVGLD